MPYLPQRHRFPFELEKHAAVWYLPVGRTARMAVLCRLARPSSLHISLASSLNSGQDGPEALYMKSGSKSASSIRAQQYNMSLARRSCLSRHSCCAGRPLDEPSNILGLHHFVQQHHQQRHVGFGGRKPLIFFYETNKQIAVHVKARVSSFTPSAQYLSRHIPRCEEKD
jgi:hypothetical protein